MEIPPWLSTEAERLSGLVERDQLPHALLIHGPVGTGRRLLAMALIGRLFDLDVDDDTSVTGGGAFIDEEAVPRHPDFTLVQPPADKRFITVDRIRELIGNLNLTSHQSGYKAALVNPAHAMNRHAANSLLKTLEEPPGRSVIVLITDSLARLPATIVSRCQRVRVPLPNPEQEALPWLQARAGDVDWERILPLAGNAPIKALEYQRSGVPDQFAEFERDIDALELRRSSPGAVAKRWSGVDPELCLDWLYGRISAEARNDAGNPQIDRLQNAPENLNIERTFAELRHIGELKRLQGSGLNTDLQLSGLLSRWYGRRAAGL